MPCPRPVDPTCSRRHSARNTGAWVTLWRRSSMAAASSSARSLLGTSSPTTTSSLERIRLMIFIWADLLHVYGERSCWESDQVHWHYSPLTPIGQGFRAQVDQDRSETQFRDDERNDKYYPEQRREGGTGHDTLAPDGRSLNSLWSGE